MEALYKGNSLGYKWVAEMIFDTIKDNPNYSPRLMVPEIHRRRGAKLTYYIAWKARKNSDKMIYGKENQSYALIASYLSSF